MNKKKLSFELKVGSKKKEFGLAISKSGYERNGKDSFGKYGYQIFEEYEQLFEEYCHGNADLIAESLSDVIESVESDLGETLQEDDLNYVIKQSVEILFVTHLSGKYRKRSAHLKAVINRYGKDFIKDLGGQQTPCTFDETLLQKRLATSTTTARSGVKSILKSLGLKKVFNYLINEMKSLISRRCE